MNREVSKFFSGAFAGIAYAHASYAVAASNDIIDEPVFLGKKWGVGFMWSEAIVYTAISVALGYLGWRSRPVKPQGVGAPETNGQGAEGATASRAPLSAC